MVTMAKALGNGMPVGACWARAEVAAAFVPGDHGSTFGGQPLAMSAARATLAVMEAETSAGRAAAAGARLRAGLRRLPGVDHVRGEGLLLAAVLVDDVAAAGLRRALRRGAGGQRRHDPTCSASPRRCWCPTPRSTGRWPRVAVGRGAG